MADGRKWDDTKDDGTTTTKDDVDNPPAPALRRLIRR
jgi:hypothetical protein